MTYSKPLFAPAHSDRESAGCCFYFNNAGQGFYYYPNSGGNGNGNVATVGNNSASVTPLCIASGTPLTAPQTFGVPAGVTGVNATVANDGSATLAVDTASLGGSVAGQPIPGTPTGAGLPTGCIGLASPTTGAGLATVC